VLQANRIFDFYEAAFPGSEVVASTFDDYYRDLENAMPSLDLPVFTEEIGDTWIYGKASMTYRFIFSACEFLRIFTRKCKKPMFCWCS
jgi:hypothetical protein